MSLSVMDMTSVVAGGHRPQRLLDDLAAETGSGPPTLEMPGRPTRTATATTTATATAAAVATNAGRRNHGRRDRRGGRAGAAPSVAFARRLLAGVHARPDGGEEVRRVLGRVELFERAAEFEIALLATVHVVPAASHDDASSPRSARRSTACAADSRDASVPCGMPRTPAAVR